jgi:hypothetical protein
MPAPKGNQFYKYRKTSGAPLKYTAADLERMWSEYLEQSDNSIHYKNEMIKSGERAGEIIPVPAINPLTLKSFCLFSGISEETLTSYCDKEMETKEKDLFDIATHIRESIIDYIDKGCTNGTLVSAYGARLTGRADNINITGESTAPIINITMPPINND